MSKHNEIKFEGRVWNILKDCGSFVVASIGDEVRNIKKDQVNKHPSNEQDSKQSD